MTLPCRPGATGTVISYAGQEFSDCADCSGCATKSFEQRSAIIGGAPGIEVTNIGGDFRLTWGCPGCGCRVSEPCTPIEAIPLADEIQADPLCFACRTKRK